MWSKSVIIALSALCGPSFGKIHFHESFENQDNWVVSEAKEGLGKFEISSGGLKTSEDAKFYAASTEIAQGISNEGKTLVVSFSVKHGQGIGCGGGYIKIGPQVDGKKFDGETPYFLMFGPDKCGGTSKIHTIFGGYKTKGNNLLWKKTPSFPTDKLTHVYTLVVSPDNTYEVFVDQESKEKGKLEEDWEFLKAKEIDDPEEKKPADWVDEAQIDDPEDKKPEDWDTIPEKITDPEAKQPEDWDTEDDGEWEAPQISNPAYKGPWSAKRIENPAYKGVWAPKKIANPEYAPDEKMYATAEPLKYVAVDIWQVEAGSIFDNIIIADDLDEVNAIVDTTWKATKDAEKAAQEAIEAAEKKESEEAAKKTEEAAKEGADADDEDEKDDPEEDL